MSAKYHKFMYCQLEKKARKFSPDSEQRKRCIERRDRHLKKMYAIAGIEL